MRKQHGKKPARRVTISDVAERAGVAKGTVSRVLAGTYPASQSVIDRVNKAVEELDYTPSVSATALATGRSNAIAMLMTEPFDELFSDPTYSTILKGAWDQMASTSLVPILLQVYTPEEREKALKLLGNQLADAVIHLSPWRDDGLLTALRDSRIPVVLCGLPGKNINTEGFSVIYSDDVEGAALAAKHLVDKECTHPIAILGPEDEPASLDRLQGYRSVFSDVLSDDRIAFGGWSETDGINAMSQFIDKNLPFDSVLCASDRLARGALSILEHENVAVPEEVKVIGYDDHPAISAIEPKLTTVAQPMYEQGGGALHLAQEMLDGQAPSTTVLPVKIRHGKTT
ncbi:MAG: LacI family DNA-binding transcriptional regulator [Gleimia sp.]|jgi:DNA-binding LacI/PurR family transcriptional regulator